MAKSKNLILISMFASLYVVMNLMILPYTFGLIQCRIGDSLYPLIALFGLPALYGCVLGQFIFNLLGYNFGFALGILDVLISPLLFIIPKYVIYKYNNNPEIGVIIHIIFVALWIPLLLNWLFNMNIILSIITVVSGEIIAEGLIGLTLYNALKRRITK